VPLLKDNEIVGTITLGRQQVQPFTDKQISLFGDFAAQATIALESTRLERQYREAQMALAHANRVATMGLSICRSIIEAHGGRLWAIACEPQGALFQFTIPATRADGS
jgi:K+-sensing histidine kinase KdpD